MADDDGAQGLGQALAALLQIVFSLTFPLSLILTCLASWGLASFFAAPELSLWAAILRWLLGEASQTTWVAIVLGLFVLASLPLAWIALREQELRMSRTILFWVMALIILGFMFWLRTVWVEDANFFAKSLVYAFLLFAGIFILVEAVLSLLGLAFHVRRNRARSVAPPRQQPHGGRASGGADTRGNEPETI